MGNEPIDIQALQTLGVSLESRGSDACGVVLADSTGKVSILKEDEQPWKFLSSKAFLEFIEAEYTDKTVIALVHTRFATKGNPRDNKNNHPLYSGKTAVIHNGVISNDDYLFRDMKMERKAETDSDVIRAILDVEGFTKKGIRELCRMSGSAAIAAVNPDYPNMLLLGRSGSPIVTAECGDFFAFASEKQGLHRAFRPVIQRWGMKFQEQRYDIGFSTMPDDSIQLLELTKGDVVWHDRFHTILGDYRVPNYEPVRGTFCARQESWDEKEKRKKEAETRIAVSDADEDGGVQTQPPEIKDGAHICFCPNLDCRKKYAVQEEEWKKGLEFLYCTPDVGGCGTVLNKQPGHYGPPTAKKK